MTEALIPIGLRSHEEERTALLRLAGEPPELLLVASDLHLSAGRDPETGTFPSSANFLAAETFARWLEHFRAEAGRAALVLNGDTFDFIRVVDVPDSPQDFQRWRERLIRLGEPEKAGKVGGSVGDSEKKDGLKTDDYKTLWKLLVIFEGHEPLFEALARWIGRGGKLVVVKGNHDPELHWPLVRRALRDEVLDREAARGSAPKSTATRDTTVVNDMTVVKGTTVPKDMMVGKDKTVGKETVWKDTTVGETVEPGEASIAFADEGFVLGNLYIEHGHQYEAMTRIEGGPVLEDDPSQINLPLGSFVNRYLINKIELLDPFIDNMKPVQQALFAVARRHPIKIFAWYVRGARFMKKALLKRRFFNGAVALLLLASLAVPLLTLIVVALCVVWPEAGERLTRWIPVLQERWAQVGGSLGGLLFPLILPYLLGAVREALRDLGLIHPPRDRLVEGARGALGRVFPGAEEPRRVYAVMGHSHVQDVQKLAEKSTAEQSSGKVAAAEMKNAGASYGKVTAAARDADESSREAFYINTGTWIPLWPLERRDLIGRVIYSFARFDLGADGEYRHQALEWDDQALEPRPARILVPHRRR